MMTIIVDPALDGYEQQLSPPQMEGLTLPKAINMWRSVG